MSGAHRFDFDGDFGFALVDRVCLEGLAFYFGDRNFGFALDDRVRLEGLAFYFGDLISWFIKLNDDGLQSCLNTMFTQDCKKENAHVKH